MQVTPHEGLFRYWVRSESRDMEYLVDLTGYNGNGWCGCENFAIKREPLLVRGAKPKSDELRCKHIIRAREFLGRQLVYAALKLELKKSKQ